MTVTNCVVASGGAGVNSGKHLLRKTSATNPFSSYSIGDAVYVYNNTLSTSGSMYVIADPVQYGGDWVMALGSVTRASKTTSTYGATYSPTIPLCTTSYQDFLDSNWINWNGQGGWLGYFSSNAGTSAPTCGGLGVSFNETLGYELYYSGLYLGNGGVVSRELAGSVIGISGTATAQISDGGAIGAYYISVTWDTYTGYYGTGDDLWNTFGEDTSDIILSSEVLASGTTFKKGKTRISILEKIKRLGELHDPDLIDIEYIQYFANYLGYDVTYTRDDAEDTVANNVTNFSSLSNERQQEEINKQLRFMIRNLPTWSKIKTTRSSLNILLYSFGLIAVIQDYYATDYSDVSTFVLSGGPSSANLVTNKHFITPHFTVTINLDASVGNFSLDADKMSVITKNILAVKPINTVFRGINGWISRPITTYADLHDTKSLFITVPYYGYIGDGGGSVSISGGYVS